MYCLQCISKAKGVNFIVERFNQIVCNVGVVLIQNKPKCAIKLVFTFT